MCGVFGIINFDGVLPDKIKLKKISNYLSHRGPDGEGIFTNDSLNKSIFQKKISVGLVHRRLSIIDLHTGYQPMTNEDSSIWIVLNGEIYNYDTLRYDLEKRGHKFKTNTDTEVILHLYEEYKEKCLEKLIGMFAIAIWDEKEQTLFLARDRLGKKPLLYYQDNSVLIFASEINCFFIYSNLKRDIDYGALYQYLNYSYIPAPNTAFKKIKKLLPATYLIYKDGKMNIERYWNLDFSNKIKISEYEAKEQIKKLLIDSVKIRMKSDVPIGAFLSGGLDSSIIVGILSNYSHYPVKTFSINSEDETSEKINYSKLVADYFKCTHHSIILYPDMIKYLPQLITYFGEPHGDYSAFPTFILSMTAKKYVSVVLIGEGADELFAGYNRYFAYKIANKFDNFPILKKKLFLKLFYYLSFPLEKYLKIGKAENFIKAVLLTPEERYIRWLGIFSDNIKGEILGKDFLTQIKNDEVNKELLKIMSKAKEFGNIDQALFTDIMFFLPYDLLTKIDISTMSFALEARAPFLDHRLVEFAASLPPQMKVRGLTNKYILKQTFYNLLPKEIILRRKTGFPDVLNSWFRKELKDYVRDILLSSKARGRGYFNMAGIEKILEDHISGKGNYGHQIWTLLIFELWHNIFIDEVI